MEMLLAILSAAALWSSPMANHCVFFPAPKGERVLLACRPGDAMQLAVVGLDGRRTEIADIEPDMVSGGVPTGPAAWSPTGDHVALEIGLDEEPGVLLITLGERPSALFVDRVLVDAGVSGAQPQWDSSGKWLIFATSGTGEWNREGVYAMRVADGAVFRLLTAVPRSLRVADDVLYLQRVDRADPAKSDLAVFRLPALLRSAERVGTAAAVPARKRSEKE